MLEWKGNGEIMSLSDCIKCWDAPCTCGYEYRKMNRDARIKLASVILGIHPANLDCWTDIGGELMIPEYHPKRKDK